MADPDLALLLAEADGRLGTTVGAAWLDGAILHLSDRPGGTSSLVPVEDADSLIEALSGLDAGGAPSALGLQLAVDLDAPVEVDAVLAPRRQVVATLNPAMATLDFLIVAGPGVSRGGHQRALARAAAAIGCGVVNTWGAKGVLRWDSPFHFGTAGLQAEDARLAGVHDAEIVITTGLDPDESPPSWFEDAVVLDVHPSQLPALTMRWTDRFDPPDERPALYRELSAVATPLYERATAPLSPARCALHLSGARPADGVVISEAGHAGFWLARTFPTGEAGSVLIPATRQRGFAAAAAHVAALDGRRPLAVIDELDDETEAMLELSRSEGVAYGLQVWHDAGGSGATDVVVDVDRHVQVTLSGFEVEPSTGPVVHHVEIDRGALEAMVGVAGPVVAWGGLSGGRGF